MKKPPRNLETKLYYLFIPLFLLLSACNGFRVDSNQKANVDFAKYNSYAWLPVPDSAGTLTSAEESSLVSAVNMEMQNRGYSLDASKPDLLVLVHRNFDERQYTTTRPLYNSYRYYRPGLATSAFYTGTLYPYYYTGYQTVPYITAGYGVNQVEYTAGQLVIDVIDREKNQIVWRGSSTDRLNRSDLPTGLIAEYINEIYDQYPVEGKGQQM